VEDLLKATTNTLPLIKIVGGWVFSLMAIVALEKGLTIDERGKNKWQRLGCITSLVKGHLTNGESQH